MATKNKFWEPRVAPNADEVETLPLPEIPSAVWDALKEYNEESERLTGGFHD